MTFAPVLAPPATDRDRSGTPAARPARCTPECARLCTPDGLAEAYRLHGAELLGLCRRLLDDAGLAEDVTQEVFVRAWRRCDRYRPELGSLRTWLFAVARNAVVDAARARARRPVSALVDEDAPHVPAPDEIERLVVRDQVRQALGTLPPGQRAAVVEVYVHERSYEEAARALGVPVGTVKSRLYYGLRALREAMADTPAPRAG